MLPGPCDQYYVIIINQPEVSFPRLIDFLNLTVRAHSSNNWQRLFLLLPKHFCFTTLDCTGLILQAIH